MARALARDVEISTKISIEIAKWLNGRTTAKAKTLLENVLLKTQAVPFTRFTNGVGHRKGAGIAAGRFPDKAATKFLELIKSVETNAQAKGLSSNLKIIQLLANKGSDQFRSGRQRRRSFKRTHLEIVVEEQEEKKKEDKKASKKDAQKSGQKQTTSKPTEGKKTEVKVVEKKTESFKAEEKKLDSQKTEKKTEEKPKVTDSQKADLQSTNKSPEEKK